MLFCFWQKDIMMLNNFTPICFSFHKIDCLVICIEAFCPQGPTYSRAVLHGNNTIHATQDKKKRKKGKLATWTFSVCVLFFCVSRILVNPWMCSCSIYFIKDTYNEELRLYPEYISVHDICTYFWVYTCTETYLMWDEPGKCWGSVFYTDIAPI